MLYWFRYSLIVIAGFTLYAALSNEYKGGVIAIALSLPVYVFIMSFDKKGN